VRQVAVPMDARALSTLLRIDYADAFVVDTDAAQGRTAGQWARLILQDAPLTARTRLVAGWAMIGLKLRDDPSGRSVLGWQVRALSPEFVLLGADSRIGMPAELLFKPSGDALLMCTFVQQDNPVAHAVWAAIEPLHVRVVRDLLEQADARLPSARRAGGEP
jgi:hypothetical protein